jgi:hypothetical protein
MVKEKENRVLLRVLPDFLDDGGEDGDKLVAHSETRNTQIRSSKYPTKLEIRNPKYPSPDERRREKRERGWFG